jgi:hypothetical protein
VISASGLSDVANSITCRTEMEHCRFTPLADKNIYIFSAIVVYICAHRSEKEVILNLKNNGYMQNTLITFHIH